MPEFPEIEDPESDTEYENDTVKLKSRIAKIRKYDDPEDPEDVQVDINLLEKSVSSNTISIEEALCYVDRKLLWHKKLDMIE
jgi:hypothetical protein